MRGGALLAASLLVAVAFVAPAASGTTSETLLTVDDGEFFYDGNPDDDACVGTTNAHTQGVALRHWHVGLPLAPAAAEVAGGYGCLGGPTSWTVTVDDGHEATVTGEVRYTWDEDVPGGGFNDVQIHVEDEQGALAYSTLEDDGPQPVNPLAPAIHSHEVDATLGPGTYTIEEDVFSGEHTAWLTTLTVTQSPSSGGGGGYG